MIDINTCFETTRDYRLIAFYSHLVPTFITVGVSTFILIKSKFSRLSNTFFLFTGFFCLWLIGDVIVWTSNNYNLVTFLWAPLDYFNVIFYVLAAYFFTILAKDSDAVMWEKIAFFVLILPAWWITATNQSISTFYQPVCEALNNDFLTQYKLFVEVVVVLYIIIFSLICYPKSNLAKRKQIVVVAFALCLFFTVFSVTEYISSNTGLYEINLYSLFVLPLFLFMIIYSIADLEIFRMRLVGSQLLAYVLVILVGSQFFFLQNTTERALTVITFGLSLGFGILLIKNEKKEADARDRIKKWLLK